jgi:hypothetical protein
MSITRLPASSCVNGERDAVRKIILSFSKKDDSEASFSEYRLRCRSIPEGSSYVEGKHDVIDFFTHFPFGDDAL